MTALASFAMSQTGLMYARICDRWGLDPGAPLEEIDDVLAFNLRGALALAMREKTEDDGDPTGHRAFAEQARARTERARALIDG